MFESPLNPHATSFIPSQKSEAIRKMAARSVAELWKKKKVCGEQIITNAEIAELVGHIISIGYKKLTESDKTKVQNYLNSKLHPKVPDSKLVSKYSKIESEHGMKKRSKGQVFDLSKFKIPQMSFLLVAFWGLYRHEQPQRPLVSLTFRPDFMTDKIWSLTTDDKKLWNKSCVSEPCECPAMFGYSIPSNFFGDLPHLNHKCPVQKIHLNPYSESRDGTEFILTYNRLLGLDEQPLQDFEVNVATNPRTNDEVDADTLRDQFETIVSGIFDLISKFEPSCEIENDEVNEESDYISFWDDIDTKPSHVPMFQQNRDSLVDDNDHPLLEASNTCYEKEVSLEVKEMIRKSLIPKKNTHKSHTTDVEEKDGFCEVPCKTPCSIWCNSAKKSSLEETNMDFDVAKDLQHFKNAPLIDLVSLEQPGSKQIEPVNIILKPAETFCGNKINPSQCLEPLTDHDYYLYDAKFASRGVTAHAFELSPPKDMFAFPKKNPVNFKFQPVRDIWQDTDSGFISSSSEDDILGEIYESDSTWKFVSAEDSLWQPLPECVETKDSKMLFPRTQAQNFRHRRSVC